MPSMRTCWREGQPNTQTLTTCRMSASSEATRMDSALEVIDLFARRHGLAPDADTYYQIIRMHVFCRDIKGALQRFDEMKDRGPLS